MGGGRGKGIVGGGGNTAELDPEHFVIRGGTLSPTSWQDSVPREA
jgi:hypothetical protein